MATILVVDDQALNRELIHAYLEGGGHELVDAKNGEEALALVESRRPDIVLLDIMMPGLNGYDVTRRLKSEGRGAHLPIILISALSDRDSRLEGLRAGADEFLSKPVDRHELIVRVGNLLRLREREVALLRRDTEHEELRRSQEEMMSLIVHDLKGPLSAVLANVGFLHGQRDELTTENAEVVDDIRSSSQRMLNLIHGLLDVSRAESGQLRLRSRRTNVSDLLASLVRQRALLAHSRGVVLETHLTHAAEPECDPDLLNRVFENLLDNALRYTPEAGRIVVREGAHDGCFRVEIGNTGMAVPEQARAVIFEKFGQEVPGIGRMNLGLGLYFCRLVAEAHGGRIWVEETRELPTVFMLDLPLVESPSAPS